MSGRATRRTRPAHAKPPSNDLLRSMSRSDYARLAADMVHVDLAIGDTVADPLKHERYVFFPETAVLSLIVVMKDGTGVEAATVGNEGLTGLSSFLDAGPMNTRCLAQIGGEAQRITSSAFKRATTASAPLRSLLSRYTLTFVNSLSQSVACNRLHTIDHRCARWLLMTHDRVGRAPTFDLTQEFLSFMLGVRREGVSKAARVLQEQGIIRYRRGHISVLDRRALERASCECYAASRADYARLLG